MTRFRILSLVVAVLVVVSSSYAIQRVAGRPATDGIATPTPGAVSADIQLPQLERQIADIVAQLADGPPSAYLSRYLGRLLLEQARILDDLDVYAAAEQALTQSLALQPQDSETLYLLAKTAMADHDFSRAVELAGEALTADPGSLDALGALADAQIEIGDYEAASAGYDRLADVAAHEPAVLVRLARLAFLHGDTIGALSLAEAAEAKAIQAGGYADDLAFYELFLADLALRGGNYNLARDAAERAMATHPGARSVGALAAVHAALGDHHRAIELYEEALLEFEEPKFLVALGDLYALDDRPDLAAGVYSRAEAVQIAGGTSHVRERVRYLADHGFEAGLAVELAATELESRQDIYGYDAYAWALYRAGRYAEARAASDQAMRLGTQEAPLYLHAGLISTALGDYERAGTELNRALEISPGFDPLLAPEAEAVLAELRM